MNTHADKTQENKSHSIANAVSQKKSGAESTLQFMDNRPEAVAQWNLQDMANNSLQAKKTAQLQSLADNSSSQQQLPIQKKENNTGLPDNLKTSMENLSGMSLDDVKVHRNSDKPAQLQAHAYAQGADIHLGPGQEKHLPHEAWHVVQQKQGRVKPTIQMKGKVNVNDDAGLEKEADVMGSKALQLKTSELNNLQHGSLRNSTYQLFKVPQPINDHIADANKLKTDIQSLNPSTFMKVASTVNSYTGGLDFLFNWADKDMGMNISGVDAWANEVRHAPLREYNEFYSAKNEFINRRKPTMGGPGNVSDLTSVNSTGANFRMEIKTVSGMWPQLAQNILDARTQIMTRGIAGENAEAQIYLTDNFYKVVASPGGGAPVGIGQPITPTTIDQYITNTGPNLTNALRVGQVLSSVNVAIFRSSDKELITRFSVNHLH